MKINPISFKGVYAQVDNQWVDFSNKKRVPVTPEQIKADYNSAKDKSALLLSSDYVVLSNKDTIEMKDKPVILTGDDAKEYKGYERIGAQIQYFSDVFKRQWAFFDDVSVKKTDNIDKIVK